MAVPETLDPRHVRELLEQRIDGLEAVLTLRMDRIEQATVLQAAVYERRLTDLNHARAIEVQKEREFVNVGVYEQNREEYRLFQNKVNSFMDRNSAVSATYGSIVSITLALAALAVALLRLFI